jgi:8-oxo-dGTP pyrophosphatase MutT (NUDIX family)
MTAPEPSPDPWDPVAEELLGTYSIFSLTRTTRCSPSTGRQHRFLRLDAPDWVNVVAVTDAGELVLVEQFRHGNDAVTLEIPGGAVDPGESPEHAGLRELEEETGYRAKRVQLLGTVDPNPAFQSNRCWTYLATGCSPTGSMDPDPSEEIVLRLVPLHRFAGLIDDGRITHSLVVAAHDHLSRGLRRGAPWAEEVRAWIV